MSQSRNTLQVRVLQLIRRLLIVFICIVILGMILFHFYFCPPKISYKMEPPPIINDITNDDFRMKETQDFLINTPGCRIPNYANTFKYAQLEKKRKTNNMCGIRYIFIDTFGDDKIKFHMHKYTEREIRCCYRFVRESPIPGHEHDQLSYTPCEVFTNNTIVWLQHEVVTVTCKRKAKIIYNDAYIIIKKNYESDLKSQAIDNSMQWNVLMIGLDSMSRTRLFDTMPHTTKYLKKHEWLDFKAYQKVGNNTFQNLMAVLTGKRMSTIYSNCTPDLDNCADFFIWEKYKFGGYKTAHGESNFLSGTLSSGFKNSPTNHHMRPLLRTITDYSSDILCAGKKLSATHLLEYVHKFAESYKRNPFFGMFWINTYVSYIDIPQYSDIEIVDLFQKLNNSEMLKDTFVIFFSDQGTSFGINSQPVQSLYDNHLPMLFIWIPLEFRRYYTDKHYNLKVNQERLITPYDVYATLADILKISKHSREKIRPEACPQCTSLFEKVSPNRTCANAGVNGICSCHSMWRVSTDDKRLENSISAVVAHIQKIWKSIKTVPCTSCEKLRYPTLFRAHEHNEGEKLYHVIAFYMSPGKLVFEGVVTQYADRTEILSVRSLTRYNVRGNCALHSQDRPFCVCASNNNCIPEDKNILNVKNLSGILLAEYLFPLIKKI